MKSAFFAPVAMLVITSPVLAADAVVSEPVAPVADVDTFSWTGGYIGINAGYGGGKFKHPLSAKDEALGETRAGSLNFDADGFVGGAQAGYNWQLDNGIVVGAEADFQSSTVKGNKSYNWDPYTLKGETKVDWFGTVRARLGYVPMERLLVYGTGGLAYGKVKTSGTLSDGVDSISGSTSKTKAGWTVGAGAEYALDTNWTVKGEYLYTDLGKRKIGEYTDADLTVTQKSDVKFHTIRAGLNFKF